MGVLIISWGVGAVLVAIVFATASVRRGLDPCSRPLTRHERLAVAAFVVLVAGLWPLWGVVLLCALGYESIRDVGAA
jgi:NADH:ubiquinone oxidoreductase subunit 6 (subunit J)